MGKIGLIIHREYSTRVRKRSFIIMSILGPLLMAGLLAAVVWMGLQESEPVANILVIDENEGVLAQLENTEKVKFHYLDMPLDKAKLIMHSGDKYSALLHIPPNPQNLDAVNLFYKKKLPSAAVQRAIERRLSNILEEYLLYVKKVNKKDYYAVRDQANVYLHTVKLIAPGKEKEIDEWVKYIGFIMAIFIYMFIFMYGVQVMRGVIEEKTSRIVEVIISSVKPLELMMGKIIGVALVGLTQFVIWIALTGIVFGALQAAMMPDLNDTSDVQATTAIVRQMQQENAANLDISDPDNPISKLSRINIGMLLGMFAFYFLGGYLLYSALFAAVGSAVDSDTDTQQFMLPVTLPLIFSYMISFIIIENPDGPAAMWFSMIPFTSPVVMMVRISVGVGETGVPIPEVLISMGLLIIGFIATTWLAARIYRTGIMMYGKKVSWKELIKWIKYSG